MYLPLFGNLFLSYILSPLHPELKLVSEVIFLNHKTQSSPGYKELSFLLLLLFVFDFNWMNTPTYYQHLLNLVASTYCFFMLLT